MYTTCRCSVHGCTKTSKNSEYSFFRFPKDAERARKWVKACKREDLLDKLDKLHNSSYRVCGSHFKREMFASDLKNRLQRLALPTVFPMFAETPVTPAPPVLAGTTIYILQPQPPQTQPLTIQTVQPQTLPGLFTYTKSAPILRKALDPGTKQTETDPLNIETQTVEESIFEVTDEAAAFIKEENDFEVEETEIPASSDTELPKNTENVSDIEETSVSLIVKEEPTSPSNSFTCHKEVQTTSGVYSSRIAKLKKSLTNLEKKNILLEQKIEKLENTNDSENILKKVTFEDYKKLTYLFCPSKDIADSIIQSIIEAREIIAASIKTEITTDDE